MGLLHESGCLGVGVSDHLLVYTVKLGEWPVSGSQDQEVRAFKKCMWMRYWKTFKVQNGRQTACALMLGGINGRRNSLVYLTGMFQLSDAGGAENPYLELMPASESL